MVRDGYTIVGYDGPTPQGGLWNLLPPPLQVDDVRPDVLGTALHHRKVAIGEAKGVADLGSAHTHHQLAVIRDFLESAQPWSTQLYVAVPRSAARELDRALVKSRLIGDRRVVRLHIPDCLVEQQTHEFAA